MSQLTTKEKYIALAIMTGLNFIIAFTDWLSRGMENFSAFMIMGSIWLLSFHLLPCYLTLKLREKRPRHFLIDWLVLYLLCVIGSRLPANVLLYLAPASYFDWLTSLWYAFPWATGYYVLYRFALTSKALQTERYNRKQAQFLALRNQLNPHFLFNTLNTISAYIHQDPDKAEQVLQTLADILRYSLDTGELEQVSLSDELLISQAYLSIEQARFGSQLTVNFVISEGLSQFKLPPLLLQPLVENCIKHVKTRPLKITIKVEQAQDGIKLSVIDNGAGFPDTVLAKQAGCGHGLKITRQRIALTKDASLKLLNNHGAEVHIRLRGKTC